jgi:small-conductance mechanosensitive channel
MMLSDILNQSFLGNTVRDYLFSLGTMAGLSVLLKVADLIVVGRMKKAAQKTSNTFDDHLVAALDKKVMPLLYLGALYVSLQNLNRSPAVDHVINVGLSLILVFLAVKFVLTLISFAMMSYWRRKGGEAPASGAFRGMMSIIRLAVWGLAAVLLLDNYGVKISALVAGLGIGGLAVAFAAQKVLGDLFSYFSIFFDRPFEIGDFIVVGEFTGTVEHIGIKSTRVRSLSGEQLIFANNDLTNSRLRNYKRMTNRRAVFRIGVTYGTPAAKVREIPAMIEKIIRDLPGAIFDRAHFAAYGDYALQFEIVYYVEGGDYLKYMEIQQQINLSIMEAFSREKIEFAYPTQTVYVNK